MLAEKLTAQPFGNEWIDYSKTYYKCKVGQDGVFRIYKNTLQNAGWTTIIGAELMLFKDGEEQPIYVSTNGVFGNNDYVEFIGTSAKGKIDQPLFQQPSFQANESICLFTDSTSYFLTSSNQLPHKRFAETSNNIPTNPPNEEPYCFKKIRNNFTTAFLPGKKIIFNYEIQNATFDDGEGFVQQILNTAQTADFTINAPNFVPNGNAKINISALRYSFVNSTININVSINGQQIGSTSINPDATKKLEYSFSSNQLNATNNLSISTSGNGNSDFYGIAYYELIYPCSFEANNQSYFIANISSSNNAQYIVVNNLSSNTVTKLYDLTNGKWYAGDGQINGKTRFLLDPSSAERSIIVLAENSNYIQTINTVQSLQFQDFSQASQQGNYLIITHNNYKTITNGHNFIDDYKTYRSSIQGGGYTVTVADVEDLYNQFAWGYDRHPFAIKNFLQFAYNQWNLKPQNTFLIGKGLLYSKIRTYQINPNNYPFSGIVPTYGDLGSDNDFVNFLPNKLQAINIGRLSAWNPNEVGDYLEKIKGFEAALNKTSATVEDDYWQKNVLHIVGGKDAGEQIGLEATMQNSQQIIQQPSFGAKVTTIKKNTTSPIDQINNKSIDSLVNNGLSIISFHGHATPNGFELNLNNPEQYHSFPKVPHFIGLGCDVAQIFNLNGTTRTVSERYLNAANGGSISMIASNNLQFSDFHAKYLPGLYESIRQRNFGATIGDHHHFIYDSLRLTSIQNPSSFDSNIVYFHLESMLLQGDPAAKIFGAALPDFHISKENIQAIPNNVSTAKDSFSLAIKCFNLGKATTATVDLKIEHINPKGTSSTINNINISNLWNENNHVISIPIDKINDVGLNKYIVTIDPDNNISEMNENNNSSSFELFIYSDNLIPVYPHEFAIVNEKPLTLKASTLNPFRGKAAYVLEIDTTELFNSPLKQQLKTTNIGGIVQWQPNINYIDSTVYYWRAAMDSNVNGTPIWSNSSFLFLEGSDEGWNQSHFFQWNKNQLENININENRQFQFGKKENILTVSNAVFSENGTTPWNTADFSKVQFNGVDIQRLGCAPWGGTIQIMVLDSATNKPWKNSASGSSGAYAPCLTNRNVYAFEFPVSQQSGRDLAAHFLDSIPNGHYVLVKNLINLGAYIPSYANDWKIDTLSSTLSLYKTLKNLGCTQIDSFNSNKVFLFFRKKGNNNYPIHQYFGTNQNDTLQRDFVLSAFGSEGKMQSVTIGPVKDWKNLKWQSSSTDGLPQNDHSLITVVGIDQSGNSQQLYEGGAQDTSLSWIDATQFPKIQLNWQATDSINLTCPQINFWRVLYTPLPEMALNPNLAFSWKDSLQVGQIASLKLGIENLTNQKMDSLLIRYKIILDNNTTQTIGAFRYKPLVGKDTLHANFQFDPKSFPGSNYLFIEANPDNDQPEQYHPNNLGYLKLQVNTDDKNPLLDVTFDGRHILDKDLVSAKPMIKIVLRDENNFLRLDDTSSFKLSIKYPNDFNTNKKIPIDGVTTKFFPASGNKNEATIDYQPHFTEDGIYELSVNGIDKTGNWAATNDYKISFEVVNKSTITNILNYPNPFSTATAFVFTLTGSVIPSQFKIQIMSVTGKVVREITKNELGPIRIGRNVTEYKWDGRDQFGQLLGNGVYFYRVVTTIDGNSLEHRSDIDLNSNTREIDKYFKNGYGKLYIMR